MLTDEPNNISFGKSYQSWILNIVPRPLVPRPLQSLVFDKDSDGEICQRENGPYSPTDFFIDSMGFVTRKYFAIQDNIDAGISDVQEALSPSFLQY